MAAGQSSQNCLLAIGNTVFKKRHDVKYLCGLIAVKKIKLLSYTISFGTFSFPISSAEISKCKRGLWAVAN